MNPTRLAGFRHVILHARAAYRLLHGGKLGPAIYEYGAARHHLGFMVGLVEPVKGTLAGDLLRRCLIHLGQLIEAAVAPRARVVGWAVAEPISEALAPFAGERLTPDEITDVAARAAAEIVRRFDVREK